MNNIGIIGAMDIEVAGLIAAMEQTETAEKAGMVFHRGRLGGKDAVVVRCGIGKVNAAVCTQILADAFGVEAVINTGVAGSLDARIEIGDIVISTDAVHHDMDVNLLGYPRGQVPGLPVYAFEADAALADLAERVCREVNPDISTFRGRIVSGDQFVADKEVKECLIRTFGASCTEMEGAAIAQSAYLNGLPFLVLRAISDKADDSATVSYETFEQAAAEHCIRLVKGMLEAL